MKALLAAILLLLTACSPEPRDRGPTGDPDLRIQSVDIVEDKKAHAQIINVGDGEGRFEQCVGVVARVRSRDDREERYSFPIVVKAEDLVAGDPVLGPGEYVTVEIDLKPFDDRIWELLQLRLDRGKAVNNCI
jgi:hypothetical protein